jgi:hypothetical protein
MGIAKALFGSRPAAWRYWPPRRFRCARSKAKPTACFGEAT